MSAPATEKLQIFRSPRRTLQFLSASIAGILMGAFVVIRTANHAPTVGDPVVWIAIHEWLSRGVPLYDGVWDHKDLGFYLLFHPLYGVIGIPGLYITALLLTLAFGIGLYFLVRPATTALRSYYLAVYGLTLYVASPVFWSIHPENAAISLLILALGLVARYPLLAGIFFAISASIKFSGVAVFVLVLLALQIARLLATSTQDRSHTSRLSTRLALGFILAAGAIVMIALLTGTLFGWLQILEYNGEYAQWRGFPPDVVARAVPITIIQNAFADASALPIGIFAQLVILPSVAAVLFFTWRWSVHSDRLRADEPATTQQVIMAFAVAIGALAVTIIQRPAIQHWQYAIGALVALVCVAAGASLGTAKWSPRLPVILVFAALSVPPITALNHDGGLAPQQVASELGNWQELGEESILGPELAALPPNSSFMFLGTNEYLIDVESLPEGSSLACRFFFQFQWQLPRYGSEILECLNEESPDFVIVDSSDRWADGEFRSAAYRLLEEIYESCVKTSTHTIWCRERQLS